MIEQHAVVHVDQYYAYALDGDFDESSVDMAHDGVLAPGTHGVRIGTGAHLGLVDLTVRVLDGALSLPADDGAIASACNLELPRGALSINHWGGPAVFEHDFGRPLTCALLVEVDGRDVAHDHRYDGVESPPERHLVTIAPVPLPGGRWRTARMDRAGADMQQSTDHVAAASPGRP
jgi:hypothetical protein